MRSGPRLALAGVPAVVAMQGGVRTIARRTNLPPSALVVVSAAVVVLAVAAVSFGVTLEGVTSGNRIAADDPKHLSWFTDYGRGAAAASAKFVRGFGAMGALLPVGALAALILWRFGVRVAVIEPGDYKTTRSHAPKGSADTA